VADAGCDDQLSNVTGGALVTIAGVVPTTAAAAIPTSKVLDMPGEAGVTPDEGSVTGASEESGT
jgi:hypothetical protein